MEYKELGIGNKINMVRVKDSLGKKTKPKQYVSQLLDIDVVNKMAKISMPIENRIIVPLEVGDMYRIVIYTPNGLYQCMSKIMKRYKESNLYVLDIQFVGKLEKYQRRQYYRLLCDMVVEHRAHTEEEIMLRDKIMFNDFETEEEKKECMDRFYNMKFVWKKGHVIDISGGGIRFSSPIGYEIGSTILLSIAAAEITSEPCDVNLKIIQCVRKEFAGEASYDIRGEFEDINNVMRENLIKFIFDQQRKRINNK